jgi:hypothetical protein
LQEIVGPQSGCNGFQRVVNRLGDSFLGSVGFGDQVGEAGAQLACRVAGGTADALHDLRKARPIPNRQRVLAPNPVEALLSHPERDDDVYMIAIVLLRRVPK